MGFGIPGGGFTVGPTSNQANAQAGLPHANVPGHLVERVEKMLEREPDHPDPNIVFSQRGNETAASTDAGHTREGFTLSSFLKPHWRGVAFATFLVLIETALLNLGPLLTQIAIDDGIDKGDRSKLVQIAIIFIVTVVISAFASYARTAFTGRLGEGLMYELRVRVFSHFQRQSLDFFTTEKAGVLMTRMTSDIESLSVLFQEGLVQFAVQFMTLAVIIAYLATLDLGLTLILVLLVVPVTVVASLWFRRAASVGYILVRDRIAEVLSDLQESLAGIRVIAAHNRRRHNVVNHRNVIGRHREANYFTARAQAIYGSGSEGFGIVAQAVLLLLGGRMVLRGEMTIGTLTAFILFLSRFFAPIQTLVQLFNQYQQGTAAITKLSDLLGTEPTVQEAPDAEVLDAIDGAIELRNVDFGYTDDALVLRNINLKIAPGEVLSVVGPTGAGKSTIAKLITRFYDPQAGSVLIDGHDLTTVTMASLRRQLGVVPQEPFLFNGTIRDNVAFARPDASQAEIEEAVTAVGLDRVVSQLPAGIDTAVHERGSSLSAGERQLLALARAFLARPRVLVLDEATSNLDLASETVIEQALDVVLEGRTAIIIAHRLATAMRADRIAVVDNGTIVELGSHDELVALGGQYAAMFTSWMRHTTAA